MQTEGGASWRPGISSLQLVPFNPRLRRAKVTGRQDAFSNSQQQPIQTAQGPLHFFFFFFFCLVMSKPVLEASQETFLHTSSPRPGAHALSTLAPGEQNGENSAHSEWSATQSSQSTDTSTRPACLWRLPSKEMNNEVTGRTDALTATGLLSHSNRHIHKCCLLSAPHQENQSWLGCCWQIHQSSESLQFGTPGTGSGHLNYSFRVTVFILPPVCSAEGNLDSGTSQ